MGLGDYKVRVQGGVERRKIARDSDFDEVKYFKSYADAKGYYEGVSVVSCYVELRGKKKNKWITIDWKVVEPRYMLSLPKKVVRKRLMDFNKQR